MAILKKLIPCAFALLLVSANAGRVLAEDKVDISPLRGNGGLWLSYGPAIINDCRAVVYRESGADEFKISDQNPKFAAVRDWLSANVERRLNLSPTKPSLGAIEVSRSITLYSDPDYSSQHMLLHIPLTGQILAPKSKNVGMRTDQRLAELHVLVMACKGASEVTASADADGDGRADAVDKGDKNDKSDKDD